MSTTPIYLGMLLTGLIGFTPTMVSAAGSASQIPTVVMEKLDDRDGWAADEPKYQGKPLTYWLSAIRNRDEETMSLAFDAIRSLGPDASAAVAELTRTVAAPFIPIDIEKDSDEVIAGKLYDIEIRSEAIDALASIGEAASGATVPLIQWALTLRVIPGEMVAREEYERFLDLVTLDAEYRIAVVDAISAFGEPAVTVLVRLLKSSDIEKRKYAAVILGREALTIAGDLMKSWNCEDKKLAIAIFGDMKPMVANAYLEELTRSLVCEAN